MVLSETIGISPTLQQAKVHPNFCYNNLSNLFDDCIQMLVKMIRFENLKLMFSVSNSKRHSRNHQQKKGGGVENLLLLNASNI